MQNAYIVNLRRQSGSARVQNRKGGTQEFCPRNTRNEEPFYSKFGRAVRQLTDDDPAAALGSDQLGTVRDCHRTHKNHKIDGLLVYFELNVFFD